MSRTTRGIAAAAIGAGVMLTALVGVEITAMASANPPRSQTCVQAIHAWEQAQDNQKDAKAARDAAKTKADAADVELARAKDPNNKVPKEYDSREAWITAGKTAAAAAHKDYDHEQKAYDQAKGRTANRKAAADEACKGDQGTPGQPGTPGPVGTPGPAGPAGAPGKDASPTCTGDQPGVCEDGPAVVIQAPAPPVQQMDGTGVVVTG